MPSSPISAPSRSRGPSSYYQQYYNDQQHNNLDVGPQNAYIDADATEAWLERQSTARLGIPASQYTVFLVNWYGRADFQFHVYYHLGVVDPDTGFDYGLFDESLTRNWGGHSGPDVVLRPVRRPGLGRQQL